MMGWFSESREMNPWAEGVYLHLSLMLHHLLSLGSKKEQSFFLRGYCRGFLLQGFRQFLSVYADKFHLGLVLHTSEFINLGWPVKIFYRGIKFYWLSVAYFKEKKTLQNIIFPLFSYNPFLVASWVKQCSHKELTFAFKQLEEPAPQGWGVGFSA